MATIWEGPFREIDPLTLRAIVQMQLEDTEELESNAKGKQREGTMTDAQMALQMYAEDLKTCDESLKDRKMAQSIAVAVLQDGAFIQEAYRLEQQAARDHEMAMRLSHQRDAPPAEPSQRPYKMQKTKDPWEDPELLEKAAAIYMQMPEGPSFDVQMEDVESDEGDKAESSAWAATRKTKNKPERRPCLACGDEKEFYELARVPCNHEYCRPCLESLFRMSMRDETLFPPRCDKQEITLEQVRFFLPSDLAKEFETKYAELSTKNRTYCHDASCSTFILTLAQDELGTCPRCGKTTCTTSKAPSHTGDCPEDTTLEQLKETANANQWQRCLDCNRFVELSVGCNHMTCPCGAHFCYVCGSRWHTCSCPQWEEQNLLARATQIVDRNPQRRLFQPQSVAHTQPETQVEPPSSTIAAAAGPASRLGVRATDPVSPATSLWQDDFSDHSEWEHDWWLETDEIARAPEQVVEEEQPLVDDAAKVEAATKDAADLLRSNAIAEVVEFLRDNHACTHDKWRFVKGRHTCEECRHVLREFIFECKQCHLQACRRCRRNRL